MQRILFDGDATNRSKKIVSRGSLNRRRGPIAMRQTKCGGNKGQLLANERRARGRNEVTGTKELA